MIRELTLRWVAEAFPALVYGHPRTYVVVSVDAEGRCDLEPPPDAGYLMPLKAVEQWAVAEMIPAKGTEVLVQFRDANPARPVIIGARVPLGDEAVTAVPAGSLPATWVTPPAALRRLVRFGDPVLMPYQTAGNGLVVPLVPGGALTANISRVKA